MPLLSLLLMAVSAGAISPSPDFDGISAQDLAGLRSAAGQARATLQSPEAVERRAASKKSSPGVELRFPTLEHFVLRNPEFLAQPGLPLLPDERKDAEDVFGKALDYDAVRVAVARIKGVPAMTFGNVIRLPTDGADRAMLIHELVHVWQFQTGGSVYVSRSVIGHIGPRDPYDYALEDGKKLADYGVEQQAQIVEDWFRGKNGRRWDARYQALAAELKDRRPIYRSNAAGLEEAAAVQLNPRLQRPERLPSLRGPFDDSGLVPQLELRFPTPF